MTSALQNNPHALLYNGQKAAQDVLNTHLLPRYSQSYIDSQTGWAGVAYRCYALALKFLDPVSSGIQWVTGAAAGLGDALLGAIPPFAALREAVYPLNPVNGERHFIAIPRSVEKLLGDTVFFPLYTAGYADADPVLVEDVNAMVAHVCRANQALLNPNPEETSFEYRARTVEDPSINAFAVPGGGMLVSDALVNALDRCIRNGEIRESKITFADGSEVTVDLSGVRLEDALAAVVGHEMTHVASRHSMASLFVGLIHTLLLKIGQVLLIHTLQSKDEEYQRLLQIPRESRTQADEEALLQKQQQYQFINTICQWLQERISMLDRLFRSRQNEYEADTTGAYFAHQAHYNPLGALYTQEFLSNISGNASLYSTFEFLFTHPCGENRKTALFASIAEFAPESLQPFCSQWRFTNLQDYDSTSLSPAFKAPQIIEGKLHAASSSVSSLRSTKKGSDNGRDGIG